jgi:lysophospholipase L1-like esterase
MEVFMMRTIVGFGASSMQGAGDSAGGFFKRAQQRAARRPETASWRWINRGVGGDTTREMRARAEEVRALGATDLVVLLGCNDLPRRGDRNVARRVGLEEYAENLDRVLATLRAPRALFISSFAVSEEKAGVSGADFERYMDAALAAARRQGYQTWDLFRETRATISGYWAADGVHASDAGHEMIAAGVWRWIAADQ